MTGRGRKAGTAQSMRFPPPHSPVPVRHHALGRLSRDRRGSSPSDNNSNNIFGCRSALRSPQIIAPGDRLDRVDPLHS